MRALITGAGGFAGGHLARLLAADTRWEVWGTTFRPGEDLDLPALRVIPADLRDGAEVIRAVEVSAPDVIFHLAGQAFVPDSWADPWATIETNVRMQLNILEAVSQSAPGARVVAVTSNEVYGIVPPERLPTREDAPLDPVNPYAVSKAAQDLLAGQYAHQGLDVIRIRPFNHLGAGQDRRIVAAGFARQIALIESGLREPVVMVGNLAAERDFTDVRDTVNGYRLAAIHGEAGAVYNLGTGVSHAAQEILDFMCAASSVDVRVETDPTRLRPSDNPRTLCDAGLARDRLGWEPTIPFETTLTCVLEDWRVRVRQEQYQ